MFWDYYYLISNKLEARTCFIFYFSFPYSHKVRKKYIESIKMSYWIQHQKNQQLGNLLCELYLDLKKTKFHEVQNSAWIISFPTVWLFYKTNYQNVRNPSMKTYVNISDIQCSVCCLLAKHTKEHTLVLPIHHDY